MNKKAPSPKPTPNSAIGPSTNAPIFKKFLFGFTSSAILFS
jgi:hypothetical protein